MNTDTEEKEKEKVVVGEECGIVEYRKTLLIFLGNKVRFSKNSKTYVIKYCKYSWAIRSVLVRIVHYSKVL